MKCSLCLSSSKKIFDAQNIHGRIEISTEKFPVYRCKRCQLIFPGANPNKSSYYKKYYGRGYSRRGNWLELMTGKVSLYFKQRLIKKYKKGGNLLDIGCGKGGFLVAMPEAYQKWGVEIDRKSCEHIRRHHQKITVVNSKIEKAQFKGLKFDIITLWHVLEHLSHPEEVLRMIYQYLDVDGVLIIETPNTNSLGFRLAKQKWFHLDCPRHLFLFNTKNLVKFLKKNKFKVVEIKGNFIDYPLDFLWDLNNYIGFQNKFLKTFSILLLFLPSITIRSLFLLKPEISETVTIIAKK